VRAPGTFKRAPAQITIVRIGLNLLHALPEIGGGWNYISNLIAGIAREDDHNEYVAFVTEASAPLVPPRPNFRVVMISLRSHVRSRRLLYENTSLQALVRRERLDCLHWFANSQGIINSAPAVVTIYDLQPFLPHARLSPAKRAFLRWRLRATARSLAVLLPMSQTTAAALENRLGANPTRMTVIPPMLEPVFRPADPESIERCRARYTLPERFWLYVSHMYDHKNHERLLRAYQAMRLQTPSAWPLVFRGDRQPGGPNVTEVAAQLGLSGNVICLPNLKRDDLPALYGAATALVFPSLYEGAGIPVLEAQACGCPVVASGIPAIREFAGDAAHYFDPLAPSEIQRAMMAVAADPHGREDLRTRGLERARIFRETPVIERLLAAYEQAGRISRDKVNAHAAAPDSHDRS
jgi:alpha-1,3-rhamnosyl/mannosyltransferase